MELVSRDLQTINYVRSEAEFKSARLQGVMQRLWAFFARRNVTLTSLQDVISDQRITQTTELGLQDVPLNQVRGTVNRSQDFTRYFAPHNSSYSERERWRNVYTLAVTGRGFPPVELYKLGSTYYVRDGHHRISIAAYLGWRTIQAHVTALSIHTEA